MIEPPVSFIFNDTAQKTVLNQLISKVYTPKTVLSAIDITFKFGISNVNIRFHNMFNGLRIIVISFCPVPLYTNCNKI